MAKVADELRKLAVEHAERSAKFGSDYQATEFIEHHAADLIDELAGALEEGRNLIAGDSTGAEWKQLCNDFRRRATAALRKARGED